jgi:small GTP-binding protein
VAGTRIDTLSSAVEVLSELASPDDRAAIEDVRARVSTRRLRILIAGEAKRGKSTLINGLIGRDVLPVGVVPVTAVVTTVRREPNCIDEFVMVHFLDGRRGEYGLETLADFVTEHGNPDNSRGVRSVDLLLGAGPLDHFDVELVDTPGTGSVFEHNTLAARDALDTLDAAIFIVTADPPISAAERDLLGEVRARSVRTFVVLNKADQLDDDDLRQAKEFTEAVCAAVIGQPTQVFVCSARAGVADPGFANFTHELDRYLASSASADVDIALRGHLARLASGLLDAAMLTERSLHLAESDSADRVQLFQDRITELAGRGQDVEARCWAIERGLRRSLDQSAAQLSARLIETGRARATAAFELADLPPEQVEERARAIVVDLIRDEVDRWRSGQAEMLEQGLNTIGERVTADLERQVAELRAAARDLLDITLSWQADTQLLRPSNRFWYAFDRPVGLEPPLAGTVRRIGPGRSRRAIARVLDEIPELADRQVGRARADLQQRLRESIHTVLATLYLEHQQTLQRVQAAMAEATALSAATSNEYRARRDELGSRIRTLRAVLAELQDTQSVPPR